MKPTKCNYSCPILSGLPQPKNVEKIDYYVCIHNDHFMLRCTREDTQDRYLSCPHEKEVNSGYIQEVKLGGGHHTCELCGKTVFGSKLHICKKRGFYMKNFKECSCYYCKNDKLIIGGEVQAVDYVDVCLHENAFPTYPGWCTYGNNSKGNICPKKEND